MSHVTDRMELGYFPLQDHSIAASGRPLSRRQSLGGARIEKIPSPDDGDGTLIEIGREKYLGTLGDVHPWLFWQTRGRELRGMGLWAQAVGGVIIDSDAYYGASSIVQPIRDRDWTNDTRFDRKFAVEPTGLSRFPRGALVIVMAATEENQQHDLTFLADGRLFAPNATGPGEAGTLVVDFQPAATLCMADSEVPGRGGRHARLQTIFRVIPCHGAGMANLGAEGNVVALNYAATGSDGIPGYGAIYAPLMGGVRGPITGGGSSGGDDPGQRENSYSGGMRGRDGSETPLGGDQFGGNPGVAGNDEKKPRTFGRFSPRKQGGHGVALMEATRAGGPIHAGGEDDRHRLGRDADGHAINSAHISTGANFFRDIDQDGPIQFGGVYPDPPGWPLKARTHLSWARSGMWRLWTEVPYTAPREPGSPDTPTWPPPTGGPRTGGPGHPGGPGGPGGPGHPGGGRPGGGPGTGGGGPNPPWPGGRGGPGTGGGVPGGDPPGRPSTGPGSPRPGRGYRGGPRLPTVGGPTTPGPGPSPPPPTALPDYPRFPWDGPFTPGTPIVPGPITGGGGPPPPAPAPGRYPDPDPHDPPIIRGGEAPPDRTEERGSQSQLVQTGNGLRFGWGNDGRIGTGTTQIDARDQMGRWSGRDPWTRLPEIVPGLIEYVGAAAADLVGAYSIHHPLHETFAAVSYRPQLSIARYPNFERNPQIHAGMVLSDERMRPHVITSRAWGAQVSGDWDYTEKPNTSRARGGTTDGGILFCPPRFEAEDYFAIGSAAQDVDDVTSAKATQSYVCVAPGVAYALGKPAITGGLATGSVVIRQDTAANKRAIVVEQDGNELIRGYDDGTDCVVWLGQGGNGAIRIPRGSIAQRPVTPKSAYVRVKTGTTFDAMEFYDDTGAAWRQVLAGTSVANLRQQLALYRYWEDFVVAAGMTNTATGTGNTYQQNQSSNSWMREASTCGVLTADTGLSALTTDGACRYSTNAGAMYLGDGSEWIFRVAVNRTTSLLVRFGFRAEAPATGTIDVADGVYFECDTTVSTNWFGCSAATSARTKTSTGYAVSNTNQAWQWFKIKFVSTAGGVTFSHYNAGTLAWVDDLTVTTNIPTAGTNRGARMFIQSAHNGATFGQLYIDCFATDPAQVGSGAVPIFE